MQIPYTLIRSKRRSLSLQISPSGELIVRSPLKLSLLTIENFIEQKKDWILKHQEKYKNLPPRKILTQSEIKGEKEKLRNYIIPLISELARGKNLPNITSIKITSSEKRWGSCSSKNGLCFSYRLAEYIGSPPEKGELEGVTKNKNSSHVTLPNPPFSGREFIDAIIIHELAHLIEKNHQKPFWNLVYSWMPDYEKNIKLIKH